MPTFHPKKQLTPLSFYLCASIEKIFFEKLTSSQAFQRIKSLQLHVKN